MTKLGKNDQRHGTVNGYDHCGCRCRSCTNANRLHHKRRRAMKEMRARLGLPPLPKGKRGRSQFAHPGRQFYRRGMLVEHKETGRRAIVLADLGRHLEVYAEPTSPTSRPGAAKPATVLRWVRTNTKKIRATDTNRPTRDALLEQYLDTVA